MREYPLTPEGWRVVERRSTGPFTTSVTYEHPDGRRLSWSSRRHRKHASKLSRLRITRERVWWAPHRASWWIAVLFVIGSTCFLVGPVPAFASAVGPRTDGLVFFVGSLFFTSAALLQWLETINADQGPAQHARRGTRWFVWEPRRIDWWSVGIQLLGTLFFNATTYRALTTALDQTSYDQVVWRPDAYGSTCFLVSGYLAYVEVAHGLVRRPPKTVEGWIVSVNLAGCVAFGVSAVAGYVLPSTAAPINVDLANLTTSIGALGFLVGALLLLPEGARATPT